VRCESAYGQSFWVEKGLTFARLKERVVQGWSG